MERVIEYKTKPIDIAKWFLSNDRNGIGYSNKQLQQLLFLSYGFYLALYNDNSNNINTSLFKNEFQAGIQGPVYQSIQQNFKQFGFNKIIYRDQIEINDHKVLKVLDFIIKEFGNLTGYELENISYNLNSWVQARNGLDSSKASNEPIKDTDIFNDFKQYIK